MKPHYFLAAILLPVAASFGCGPAKPKESPPKSVRIKTVELITSQSSQRYSASITPQTQVDVAFKSGGYVVGVSQVKGSDGRLRDLQQGDVVLKGAVLARLRAADYQARVDQAKAQAAQARSSLDSSESRLNEAKAALEASKGQVAEAQAGHEKAKLDWQRAQTLFAAQSLTKTDYDSARAQFDATGAKLEAARAQAAAAQSRVDTAKAEIEVSRGRIKAAEASTTEATIPLEDSVLRAPFSGLLLQRKIETGSLVGAGAVGFTLADITFVKVTFGVADLVVGKLKLGDSLAIQTEAFPGDEFRGHITAIAPSADPSSRVFAVEVSVPNPQNRLRAGMIASLQVAATGMMNQVTVVPLTAIVRSKDGASSYAVFVVEDQGSKTVARQRTVTLGDTEGNMITVVSGVKPGDRVITTGAPLVADGEAVMVVTDDGR
jgi:multidrug efflux system membrane fusion protein